MSKNNAHEQLLDFFAEVGQLERVRRSGWWTVGIKDCESVAEHSFRCAIIGYCLSKIEGCNTEKTVLMCLFNDIHEARINDLHKVVQRYINLPTIEKKALKEQTENIPYDIGKSIKILMNALWEEKSHESILARDADILECMLQGKEYYEQGYKQAKEFYTKSLPLLKSKSARKLGRSLTKWDSRAWCAKLAIVER